VAEGASGVPSGGGGRRRGVRAQPWWWRVRRIGAGTANVGRWGPGKLGDARWVGWIGAMGDGGDLARQAGWVPNGERASREEG
jgi:hypothetical protein